MDNINLLPQRKSANFNADVEEYSVTQLFSDLVIMFQPDLNYVYGFNKELQESFTEDDLVITEDFMFSYINLYALDSCNTHSILTTIVTKDSFYVEESGKGN